MGRTLTGSGLSSMVRCAWCRLLVIDVVVGLQPRMQGSHPPAPKLLPAPQRSPSFALTASIANRSSDAAAPEGCVRKAVCITEFENRLGNNLFDLEFALWTAQRQQLCFVKLPADRGDLDELLHLGEGILAAQDGIHIPRTPRKRSRVECAVNTSWGYGEEQPNAEDGGHLMRNYVAPKVDCSKVPGLADPAPASALGRKGLVIHMRSGDTMGPDAYPGHYPQPPCSFFTDVVARGRRGGRKPFKKVLIVTEPDKNNPCIDEIASKFPGVVTVQSESVRSDACKVMSATNLMLSFGSFAMSLMRFNTRLRNLYVPFGQDGDAHYNESSSDTLAWYLKKSIVEHGMPYKQHLYSFPSYNTTWADWKDHKWKMLQYPKGRMLVRTIPARGQ